MRITSEVWLPAECFMQPDWACTCSVEPDWAYIQACLSYRRTGMSIICHKLHACADTPTFIWNSRFSSMANMCSKMSSAIRGIMPIPLGSWRFPCKEDRYKNMWVRRRINAKPWVVLSRERTVKQKTARRLFDLKRNRVVSPERVVKEVSSHRRLGKGDRERWQWWRKMYCQGEQRRRCCFKKEKARRVSVRHRKRSTFWII